MEISKINNGVAFNEENHRYWDINNPNLEFVSVTTLIHEFTLPFSRDFWSAYKALEKLLTKDQWNIEKKSLLNTKKFNPEILDAYGISENDFNREQQAVLDEWDKENAKSCERGTKIHAELENSMYTKKKNIDLSKYGVGGKFECIKDYTTLDLENGVYPEYLISRVSNDGNLALAGQIDLLIKKGKHYSILDWKTNKKIDQKSFFNTKTKSSVRMKFPLNTLDDCNFSAYQLQLSTYAWMIQKLDPEAIIDDLVLVHFDHNDNMTVYHCEYLKKEVEKMLIFYKKQLVLNKRRKNRERIEY